MIDLQEIHNRAMDLAEMAEVAKIKGDIENVERLQTEAFLLESEAANSLKDKYDFEPTRSILFRSAASLAMDCKNWREAEILLATGLSGNPPSEIATEMRDLLEQINYSTKLEEHQLVLENNDLSFAVQGNDVGPGIAPFDAVMERMTTLEKLTTRTIDRKYSAPYRDAGQSKYSSLYPLFIKSFAPGSFIVTLTIGSPYQKMLPGLDDLDASEEIIDEIITCVELIETMNEDVLRERINDSAYYNNFVSLINRMAPDGEAVRQVNFISKNRAVRLDRQRSDIASIRKIKPIERNERGEPMTIEGILLFADAVKKINTGTIKIVDQDQKAHTIIVPKGMDDIVSTLWSKMVKASISQIGRAKYLDDIQTA